MASNTDNTANKTVLKDRTLWFDGVTEVLPKDVLRWIDTIPIERLAVTEINSEIQNFNRLSPIKIKTKEEVAPPDFQWRAELQSIDTASEVDKLCSQETSREGINRLLEEYELFLKNDLEMFLKLIIYLLRKFRESNVVWGVGRGSSCSLYLLYRLGLHSVDALKYNIPNTEFFKE